MTESSKIRSKRPAWAIPSNSKLEADIAYFEARLSMLDDKPTTCYQNAQLRAYSALEQSLNDTLERLRTQQQKRRKLRAKSEIPLADQLDQTDIQSILAEEALAPVSPEEVFGPASDAQPLPADAHSEIADDALPVQAPVAELAQEIHLTPESPTPSELLERDDIAHFDSDNIYLRTALFSENISFLQDAEEVEEEWGDVGEAEIQENLGQLDIPIDLEMPDSEIPKPEGAKPEESNLAQAKPPARPQPTQAKPAEQAEDDDYSDSFFDSWLKE